MKMALRNHQARQVYLITYSQANLEAFPSRERFAEAVVEAFTTQTPASVTQWACSKENHENGGQHYHMVIKLDRVQRWLRVKQHCQEHLGMVLHFSSNHVNYYTAWLYVTKEDDETIQSDEHPMLINPPQTQRASQANSQRGQDDEPQAKKQKKVKLTAFDVGEICLTSDIKTRLQLLALANRLKVEGKTDLAKFIYKKSKKALDEIISTAWEMEGAEDAIERAQMRRLDILKSVGLNGDCVCDGVWLLQAKDILNRNNITHEHFSNSVMNLLRNGRGKYRNILITGPTNCGKTFILQPLTTIFNTFSNPATTSYAWIGAEAAEVILLNDFRWSTQVITF